eukprot:Nitzschia sp. Nitz4//scaffold11_size288233//106264//107757//NITZ4_000762-RA/size288233-snap-gene-0.44-mRNA-1//-1//CDS//3329534038//5163//frame0
MNIPVAMMNDRVNPLKTNQRIECQQKPQKARGKDISRLMSYTKRTTTGNPKPSRPASTGKLLSAPTRSILARLTLPRNKTLVVVTDGKKIQSVLPHRCASASEYFPVVVHRMINDAETQNASDMMSWAVGGGSFRVNENHPDLPTFLERYFRHSKYSSFQRQLNTYGWSKMKFGPHAGMFYQQGFQKEATIDELVMIRRGGSKPEDEPPPTTRSTTENRRRGHFEPRSATLRTEVSTSAAAEGDHGVSLTSEPGTIPLKKRKVRPAGADKLEVMKRKRLELLYREHRSQEPSIGRLLVSSPKKALLHREEQTILSSHRESLRSDKPSLRSVPSRIGNMVRERGDRLRALASELGHKPCRVSPACNFDKQISDGSCHLSCQKLFSPLLPPRSQRAQKKAPFPGDYKVSYHFGSPICSGCPLEDIQALWTPHQTPQMEQKSVHPISESSVDTPFLTNPSNLNASLDQVVGKG